MKPAPTLKERMLHMMSDATTADVTFIVGDVSRLLFVAVKVLRGMATILVQTSNFSVKASLFFTTSKDGPLPHVLGLGTSTNSGTFTSAGCYFRHLQSNVLRQIQPREGGPKSGCFTKRISSSPSVYRRMQCVHIHYQQVRYIYADEAHITAENLDSVLRLSDKYFLHGLFTECVEWAKKNVKAANVCRFLP